MRICMRGDSTALDEPHVQSKVTHQNCPWTDVGCSDVVFKEASDRALRRVVGGRGRAYSASFATMPFASRNRRNSGV